MARKSMFSKLLELTQESQSGFSRIVEQRKRSRRMGKSDSEDEFEERLALMSRQISALALLIIGMQKYLSTLPDWNEEKFEEMVHELDSADGVLDGMLNGPTPPKKKTGPKPVKKVRSKRFPRKPIR